MSFVALALAGCGSGSNILGGAGSSGPQATLTQSQTQPAAVKTAKIQIAPVIGSPDNVARDLQTQLASAIGNRGMTVATAANASSEYVVRGYIVAAREKTKAKISYIWDVRISRASASTASPAKRLRSGLEKTRGLPSRQRLFSASPTRPRRNWQLGFRAPAALLSPPIRRL